MTTQKVDVYLINSYLLARYQLLVLWYVCSLIIFKSEWWSIMVITIANKDTNYA